MKINNPPVVQLKSKGIPASRSLNAGAGDVTYSGCGFRPTTIVISAVIDGVALVQSQGIVDAGTIERCTSTSHTGLQSAANATVFLEPSIGTSAKGNFAYFTSDGFALTWSKTGAPNGTAQLNILAMR